MEQSQIEEQVKIFEASLKEERTRFESQQASKLAAFKLTLEGKKIEQEKPKPKSKPVEQPQPKKSQEGGCNVINTPQAGKADKCSTCSQKSSCGSGANAAAKAQQEQLALDIKARMCLIRHKILVLSGKGGVGKSMLSAQLAYALAAKGYFVGLMDVDICGPTVPKMLGQRGQGVLRTEEGLAPVKVNDNLVAMSIGFVVDDDTEAVIWRGPRKIGLIQMFLRDVCWGALDFLIVDTPPGTSDEHLSTVQMLQDSGIDGAVVITSPQDVSVVEVGKEINFCEKMGVKVLGVVENFSDFVCPCCQSVTQVWPSTSGGGFKLAADHSVPFFGKVPLDPSLSRVGEVGVKYISPESVTGKILDQITSKVIESVEPSDK